MEQPEGFVTNGEKGEKVFWRLQKSLYSLKQSGRNWNNMLHEYLISTKFEQLLVDHCVYTRVTADSKVIIQVWVDDIIIATDCESAMTSVKDSFCSRFQMKDIGQLSWFLGIQFASKPDKVEINQRTLREYSRCKTKATPCDLNWNKVKDDYVADLADEKLYRGIVGSLIYAMFATGPDICFVVTYLSQFMSRPTNCHLQVAKYMY
jgi:hypothetical protein